MFEAYVRELITSVLGNYFENIDATPLEISFWRGDIVLRNVEIKSTVMVDFYMPFKIVAGRIGTVTLKVPWTQIYTASLEATLKDLYLIISPCQTAPYNPEEEERHEFITKMRMVQEVEEKRRAAQAAAGSSRPVAGGTNTHYKESLVMLLLKNLHLRVDGLHIRYEDAVSNPLTPFSFGIVLNNLQVHTTDSAWTSSRAAESAPLVNTFHKHMILHGLAVYLNSDGNLFGRQFQEKGQMLHALQQLIQSHMHMLKYLIGPISTEMKVRITPHPESLPTPFSLPKISIEVPVNQLTLGVSNHQFQNVLRVIETVEFMARGKAYRKFRPPVHSYSGNYALWWQFAYDCIVSEVRHKRESWNFANIKRHRELSRLYCENYYQKVVLHNHSPVVKECIAACEKALDVFNIVYVRAQVEVKRESVEQQELDNRRRYGWLATVLGLNAAEVAAELEAQLQESLTEQQKVKLNQAMGYSESSMPANYPKDYVAYCISLSINTLSTFITHYASVKEPTGKQLVELTMRNANFRLEYRPAVSGYNFRIDVGHVQGDTVGTSVSRQSPILRTSPLNPGENFLDFEWARRPLVTIGNRRITLKAKSLHIIYNAKTIQQISSCFSLPKEIELQALKLNAKARLNEYRQNVSFYLQEWITKSSAGELILSVDVDAPYIIIPENGELGEKSNALIIDLGRLLLQSKLQNPDGKNPAPEAFTAKVSDIQVLMSTPGLENGVLVPTWKRPLAASTVVSIQNFDGSIVNSLISDVRNTENQSCVSLIMNPVTVSATIDKSTAEESVINTQISDISVRLNHVSAELFKRISKSWMDMDFDHGINRFVDLFLLNMHERTGPYVQNSAIHAYIRQTDEGKLLLRSLKGDRDDMSLDKHIAHILVGNPTINVLLLSTHRIFFLTLADSYGKATILWEYTLDSFSEKPMKFEGATGNGLSFTLKEGTTKSTKSESVTPNILFVPVEDFTLCEWMIVKITEAMDQYSLFAAAGHVREDATTS